ncbi:4-hydroxy-3-methylbut-2-enyl diphosphate reductase [Rickettsiales bacterium Ac37b]|nr:4-hydroxy-3-methylbut-2-enyl diphosphate reductase [Rickettsiales bacterium Ac37b]
MQVILAKPRGFCAGVERAIKIVELALEKYGRPVYVRHEIVHNKYVVDQLKSKGAIFVNSLDEIPENSITIFSAHGVSEQVEIEAHNRNLSIIDATCPLVTKVHKEAQRNEEQDRQIILIGHRGHPEVEGTSGRVKQEVIIVSSIEEVAQINVKDPSKLSYVTQTTLSVDDTKTIIDKLKTRFPLIQGPELKDICYATQNRQNAVRELSKKVDIILVIGAINSSNSNRLKDLGNEMGIPSYLINNYHDINNDWLKDVSTIGITAGASAPEILVEEVINYLNTLTEVTTYDLDGIDENIKFKLPKELVT